jgi:hypothetical protein
MAETTTQRDARRGFLTARLTDELVRSVTAAAEERGLTRSELVRVALVHEIERGQQAQEACGHLDA